MTSSDPGATLAWLATYAIHSTVLLGAAWLLTHRAVHSPRVRDLVWKVALVGSLASASAQHVMSREPLAGRFEIRPAIEGAIIEGRVATAGLSRAPTDASPDQPAAPARMAGRPAAAAPAVTAPMRTGHVRAVSWSTVVVWSWCSIAGVLVLAFLLRRLGLSARFGPRTPVTDPEVLSLVERLRGEAGVRRAVRITQAPGLASPVALGMSEICLPEAVLDLEPEQQVSMLAHEVAHIARRDPAWLFVSCLLERALFFQPLNHVARRRLQESAEYLCDDWAARRTGSGLTLARCLVQVAEWIDTTPYPVPVSGMAESRSQFVSRIHRLIGNHALRAEPRRRWLLPFSVAMVGVVAAAAPGARAGGMSGRADAAGVEVHSAPASPAPAEPRVQAAPAPASAPSAPVGLVAAAPSGGPAAPPDEIPVPQDTGVVAALLAALKDPDVEVRRAAARSLGNLRSPRATSGLIAALKDEDDEVRADVLEALGNLRDPRALEGVQAALKDPSPRIRARAAGAIGDMLNQSVSRATGEQIVAQLAALLADSSVDVRRHAIHVLKDYDRSRPVDAYLKALSDGDKEVRQAAADALGQAEDARAVQPLIGALTDKAADVRHEAAHALGHLKDRRAAPALAALLKDPSADVRSAAIEALGELELTEAPAGLVDAAKDENTDVRRAVAQALGQIGDARAVPALVLLLGDTDGDVREEAVNALSEVRDASAISALVSAMRSSDPNVRKRAAEALGERKR